MSLKFNSIETKEQVADALHSLLSCSNEMTAVSPVEDKIHYENSICGCYEFAGFQVECEGKKYQILVEEMPD